MISRFWWLNFALSIILIFLIINTIMVWQRDVIIEPSKKTDSNIQWPKPLYKENQKPDREQYDTIAKKNLYNSQRKENVQKPKVKKEVKPIIQTVAAPKSDPKPVLEEIGILEKNDLNLFGVIIMENLKTALINNVGKEKTTKQVWVKSKDRIGEYTIEKILSEMLIVSYAGKQYKVPLFEKKENGKKGKKGKSVVKNKKPVKNKKLVKKKTPVILSTKKDTTKIQKIEYKEKSSSEEDEWIMVDTPFGKRRMKKRK